MRRSVVLVCAATAAGLLVAAAQAGRHPTTSLSVSALKVVYGGSVRLSGRVSDRRAGLVVSILARPFTRGGMGRIATVSSGAGGSWSYPVRPSIATTYMASVAGKPSRTLMVGVRPALKLHILGTGSVMAHVGAGRSMRGKTVELQRAIGSGRWLTLATRKLSRTASAMFAGSSLPGGNLRLRLGFSVNEAGPGYLGGYGTPIRYPAHGVSLRLSTLKVSYGEGLRLSGAVYPKHAGMSVRLLARPFMQAEFQPVAVIHTSTTGRWQVRVKPPFTTSYQVTLGNATSRMLTIGVRPAMAVRTLSGDRIWAHAGLAKAVQGRTLEIQRRSGGHWSTVATLKLDRRASAIFTPQMLPAGTSTLRTAISVNQVGAGFLAGFSKPFVYHR